MSEPFAFTFSDRHLGPSENDAAEMLSTLGVDSLDQLIEQTIPSQIRLQKPLNIEEALSEAEHLNRLKGIAQQNKVFKSYLGLGYYDCFTPSVILRNIFENPGWYTQYTPYQAEISQGRLEALLNFQTMIIDLTGLELANASLLDEATAAAEAMTLLYRVRGKEKKNSKSFIVSAGAFPQTIEVLKTRAEPLGIKVIISESPADEFNEDCFGLLLQYPEANGNIVNYRDLIEKAHSQEILVAMAADILALTLLVSPGELGADIAFGSTQRFGVPLGFGGPHAAYMATSEKYKRDLPGRIIGVSVDANNKIAYRMALQTREQHIRREKATSNICTAQALLAIMAGMYAVYHGPKGLKGIAQRVHRFAHGLAKAISSLGYAIVSESFFDTFTVKCSNAEKILAAAAKNEINLRLVNQTHVAMSIDETTTKEDLIAILQIFAQESGKEIKQIDFAKTDSIAKSLVRQSPYLEHTVFNRHHSETEMMRYIKSLENKDLSLTTSMIPLGSCTMKLNAASEMIPVSWPEFAKIHPFAPADQWAGYQQIFTELEKDLAEITGFAATSLQPNSGAQGEYAGLMVIRQYHIDHNQTNRDIVLIPSSAHGTNPASAVMAGMKVIVVKCDDNGNIDMTDLTTKAELHKDNLSALMVTYPSTHGVFEATIKEVCNIIHENGGLVYLDGANMNAQVGLTSPGEVGADVCHLNLHKTFSIPHGGGGPGMGPICVNEKLAPYLPTHVLSKTGGEKGVGAVSAAAWGSPSILLISYGYIKMLGLSGIKKASEYAILNANYIKARLESYYDVLYTGSQGRVAHELILDFRKYQKEIGITVEDVAKRLMDYNFHAPTMSWPVAGTIMIEPTESEPKAELDRFCEALIAIHQEIEDITSGKADKGDNVLKHSPHALEVIVTDDFKHSYSREQAAFPLPYLRSNKFWPGVGRIDNVQGDRNLVCACPPLEAYELSETNS